MKTARYKFLFTLFVLIFSWVSFAFGSPDTLRISLSQETIVLLNNWNYQAGDNPEWANKNMNDDNWPVQEKVWRLKTDESVVWYRRHIRLSGSPEGKETPMLLCLGLSKTYEIYWDGLLVGENGRIGETKSVSEQGEITKKFILSPEAITSGHHVIAIRTSNDYPRYPIRKRRIYFTTQHKLNGILSEHLFTVGFNIGFDLLAILFSIALFFGGNRHRSYLYFGIHRFGYMVYALYSFAVFHIPMNMSLNDPIMILVYIFDPLAYVFLSLFIIYNFKIPNSKLHLLLNFLIFIGIYWIFSRRYTPFILLYPVGLLVWAMKHKLPGSILAFTGVLIVAVVNLISLIKTFGYEFYISDILFVFLALLAIGRQVRAEEQKHQATVVKALRLESDLLKKNIQPHFLMNTLSTIISLIKTNPKNAIDLIRALADEFHMINKISGERLIPIDKEISICQKHLQIMGHRKSARYELIIDNKLKDDQVPPMIFHTLIENALTHAYEAYENGHFYISCEQNNRSTTYILKNDGSKLEEMTSNPVDHFEEGFGLRYVRARLEESFPGKWSLNSGQMNGFWQVNITIKKGRK